MASPKNVIYFISSPFLKFFQQTSNKIYGTFNFLLTIKDLSRENYSLREENKNLLQENAILKEADRENELLRERLALGEPIARQLVLADVVGLNPQLGQYFLINKGSADGLAPDLAVVSANNFLIGKVAEVGSRSAKVILILDSNYSVNAITQQTQINGIIRGSHGLVLNMEMIPGDQKVDSGEMVLTSGLNGSIPKDLIIGRVVEVTKKESEIFQKATLRPAADFKKIESVFIILK